MTSLAHRVSVGVRPTVVHRTPGEVRAVRPHGPDRALVAVVLVLVAVVGALALVVVGGRATTAGLVPNPRPLPGPSAPVLSGR